MADFNAHLISGIGTGTAVAAAGFFMGSLTPVETGAVMVLGTTGGLLPDIDSDTGKPLQLLFQLISVLIPVLMYPRVAPASAGTPFLLCYFTLFYLAINYIACPIIKKLTVHRGMMHSIPFAVLSGEIAFLLLNPSGNRVALYGTTAVFAGCTVHLILDELNSLSLKFGFIVVMKRSSGSALKLSGTSLFGTIVTYLLVICVGIAIAITFLPPDMVPATSMFTI